MKVYLVVYGELEEDDILGADVYTYTKGIFDSLDKAKECVAKLSKGNMVSNYDKHIHELELNEACSKLLG